MIQRGYPAIGGEIFLPVFPFLLPEIVGGIKEIMKGGRENRS